MHAGKVRTENAEPEARCTRFLAFFRFPSYAVGAGVFFCVRASTKSQINIKFKRMEWGIMRR